MTVRGRAPEAARIVYRRITDVAEFATFSDDWNLLVASMRRPCPFLLSEWLQPWWVHHGAARRMLVEAAFLDGRLVGGVPLEVESGRAGVRIAHFMGRQHAPLADLLVRPDLEEVVAPALVARIGAVGADLVDFFGLARGSVFLRHVPIHKTNLVERVAAPFMDLSSGWDESYRAKTSAKKRNLHGRRRRQLAARGDLTSSIARTEADLAAALLEAFRLHDLRRSGRPDGSEFTSPVGKAFHTDVVRRLAAIDAARILLLRIDGRAVAFHYYLVLGSTMYVHRLAFDPELSRFSPGLIATLDALEAAAAEGVTRVEFLGGDERYKLELADGVAPLSEYVGLPSTVKGKGATLLTTGTIALRLKLRRSPLARRLYVDGIAPARRMLERGQGKKAS